MNFKVALIFLTTIITLATSQTDESQAQILKFENLVDQDGNFEYAYETSNGIVEEAEGKGGEYHKGFYSYTSPEGQAIRVDYISDVGGYQPSGDALPTPHPAVAKAIEYIKAQNPQK